MPRAFDGRGRAGIAAVVAVGLTLIAGCLTREPPRFPNRKPWCLHNGRPITLHSTYRAEGSTKEIVYGFATDYGIGVTETSYCPDVPAPRGIHWWQHGPDGLWLDGRKVTIPPASRVFAILDDGRIVPIPLTEAELGKLAAYLSEIKDPQLVRKITAPFDGKAAGGGVKTPGGTKEPGPVQEGGAPVLQASDVLALEAVLSPELKGMMCSSHNSRISVETGVLRTVAKQGTTIVPNMVRIMAVPNLSFNTFVRCFAVCQIILQKQKPKAFLYWDGGVRTENIGHGQFRFLPGGQMDQARFRTAVINDIKKQLPEAWDDEKKGRAEGGRAQGTAD
jgi:hypothetical protein